MSAIPDRWKPVRKDLIELMKLADSIAEDVRGGGEEGAFQEPLDFKDRLLIANMMMGLDRIAMARTASRGVREGPVMISEEQGVVDRNKAWGQFKEILKREGYKESEATRLLGFLVTTPPGQDLLKCMIADAMLHEAQKAERPTPPQG